MPRNLFKPQEPRHTDSFKEESSTKVDQRKSAIHQNVRAMAAAAMPQDDSPLASHSYLEVIDSSGVPGWMHTDVDEKGVHTYSYATDPTGATAWTPTQPVHTSHLASPVKATHNRDVVTASAAAISSVVPDCLSYVITNTSPSEEAVTVGGVAVAKDGSAGAGVEPPYVISGAGYTVALGGRVLVEFISVA